jgi:uncharacterized integral membrane protein (TIGR00698 family)
MSNGDPSSTRQRSPFLTTEDWWAVWLGLGIILLCLAFYQFGAAATLKDFTVSPGKWSNLGQLGAHFAAAWPWYIVLFMGFLVVFTGSIRIMGLRVDEYVPGFLIIFISSVIILVLSSSSFAKDYNLEAPLVALILGLLAGNFLPVPRWLDTSLRTEYYIKTGIVLLGATLPLTLIFSAGPIAFFQATIVSICTFLAIYFAATRIFKKDPRFGAVLGAAGSVCGVSASIAVGASVKARKEQIAIAISVVTIWAIVMIFFIPIVSRAIGLHPGVAGAWIGTSEFADAAGFAAASAIPSPNDAPIQAFTLMKVIGRDIWIGIWCFVLSIISVSIWERSQGGDSARRVGAGVIWERFPKFVIGFLAASVLMTFIVKAYQAESGAAFQELKSNLINPIKTLRTWTFVFTFLCIGLTTRFRELTKFGWQPFWAFTIGVAVNVPLGFLLSALIFKSYWVKLG